MQEKMEFFTFFQVKHLDFDHLLSGYFYTMKKNN